LGSVLAFGLIASMALTLFVVPVLYSQFVRPVAETAEPAPEERHEQITLEPFMD